MSAFIQFRGRVRVSVGACPAVGRPGWISRRAALACAIGLGLSCAQGFPAGAAQTKRPNIVNGDSFYTEIGTHDENLSRLCARKPFNQKSQLRVSAYFKKDRVLLGGATGTGWNLRDPTGARRIDRDKWFRSDGFSTCEVYYSTNPKRSPTRAVGATPGGAANR